MKTTFLSISLIAAIMTLSGCGEAVVSNPKAPQLVLERNRFSETGVINLKFLLKSPDGSYVFDEGLEVMHTQKVHLVVVKNDLSTFLHLHPEHGDQFWTTQFTLQDPGLYEIYANYKLKDREEQVAINEISVGNFDSTLNYPTLTTDQKVTRDDMSAALSFNSENSNQLTIEVTKAGKPLTDLEPYMGAAGHFIIFKHNQPQLFLHAHAEGIEESRDGKLDFMTHFTEAGTYTGYLQFMSQNILYTLPITFSVNTIAQAEVHMSH
jgi:hypothetical protein